MMKIAHIINPVKADKTSDLVIAQPITFETMRRARAFAGRQGIDVKLYSAQFPGDRPLVPEDFIPTPDLERSVLDVADFKAPRKLPLIGDILDRLFRAANSADYLVYTNVDIALQPHFYWSVAGLIGQGHDAVIINRRTIPGHYHRPEDIPQMCAELGESHKGWDCFVFNRDLYPAFRLDNICIGAGWIGRALFLNLASLAKNFRVFTDLHLTFHIGNEKVWKSPRYEEYLTHNRRCYEAILDGLQTWPAGFDDELFPPQIRHLLEKRR